MKALWKKIYLRANFFILSCQNKSTGIYVYHGAMLISSEFEPDFSMKLSQQSRLNSSKPFLHLAASVIHLRSQGHIWYSLVSFYFVTFFIWRQIFLGLWEDMYISSTKILRERKNRKCQFFPFWTILFSLRLREKALNEAIIPLSRESTSPLF